jgi:hypothetical protein
MEYIHCKVVALEETSRWSHDYVKRAGGAIYRTYVFDLLKRSRLIEMDPVYELYPLRTIPLKDHEDGALTNELAGLERDESVLLPTHRINMLPDEAFYDYGRRVIREGETREVAFFRTLDLARQGIFESPEEGPIDRPAGAANA